MLSARAAASPGQPRCRPGTTSSSGSEFEGPLRDVALREGLAFFPYYSLANGFLTGKYRSKDDLGKSVRGARSVEYLEASAAEGAGALEEVAAETGAAMATVALAWLKAQPAVTAPIASATSIDAGRATGRGADAGADQGQIERLNEASSGLQASMFGIDTSAEPSE